MLEYTKLDSSSFKLVKEKTDLLEIIRSNLAMLYSEIEEKDNEVIIELPEKNIYLELDKIHFSRAIYNIISNSIVHNSNNTRILVKYFYDKGHKILIADTCIPIPDAIKNNLFDPFVMGYESRNSKNGNGIGLSISMKIIKMHNCNLELITNIEGFTKGFLVTLNKEE